MSVHNPIFTLQGSINKESKAFHLLSEDKKTFEEREITYVPGLFKIFDEIIVNSADNYQNSRTMDKVEVEINKAEGFISVLNNGKGIPVQIHKEENMYVPVMIFGHLLTGSNYDDEQ